tara:strand:- start:350 stop:814 length:465 start_codon:yes stop_codon:yes gene_type:complete
MIKNIHKYLINKKKTISTCESITGGALSSKLMSLAGSSAFFKGSVVVYNDEIKSKILGIDYSRIKKFSAVSEQISNEMAISAQKIFDSDYCIATTGNAGPNNNDEISKIGQIYVTLITPKKIITQGFVFSNDRNKNIEKTVDFAIDLLYKNLSK